MNLGNIIIVKSERSNYRKYIIIEIPKTGNNTSIKWPIKSIKYQNHYSYVVTYCLENVVDIPNVAFFVSRCILLIGNKVPDRKFYWNADHEFYSRLRIWNNESVRSTDKFVKKLILLHKNERILEKKKAVSLKDPVRKRKVYKTKVVIQNCKVM